MAIFLCLETYESNLVGQDWKFRPGELIDDVIVGVANYAALIAAGLSAVPYNAGTMAGTVARYLADHGRDDDPPGMASWFVQNSLALAVLTPLTGAVNPNGITTGTFGQMYYDTVGLTWYVCNSTPTGTVWTAI